MTAAFYETQKKIGKGREVSLNGVSYLCCIEILNKK